MSCSQCSAEEQRLLHDVRLRGVFIKVCTDCVLRLHPHAFCPTCYIVHESESAVLDPLNDTMVTCSSCYSSTHITCVGPTPSQPYICPLCVNPTSPLLVLHDAAGGGKIVDERAARVLLAASKIAAEALNKAVAEAEEEEVRRAQEAVVAKRKAKEALEQLREIQAQGRAEKNARCFGSRQLKLD